MKLKLIFLNVFFILLLCGGLFAQPNTNGSGSEKHAGLNSLYNTPNPFNETTTIKFIILNDSYVKLSVVETANGNETELVNGLLSAGEHGIIFKAPRANGREYKCILKTFSENDSSLVYTREIDMVQK